MSGYSSSVTGDENGRSRGDCEGVTTITVIHGFGEDRIEVRVDAPMVGDTQVIGQDGGIIQNSDGVQVSFGPDQLDEDTTVEVVSVAKEDLGAPPPNEDYFDFVAAFDLNVEGGEINGDRKSTRLNSSH